MSSSHYIILLRSYHNSQISYGRGAQILQKSEDYLRILDAQRMT